MKISIVLLALVAVAAAESYGKHVDYSHVPYYKFDWKVSEEKYYNDFGQVESREGYKTKSDWWVKLPGNSKIVRDDVINSESQHYSHGNYKPSNPSYKESA